MPNPQNILREWAVEDSLHVPADGRVDPEEKRSRFKHDEDEIVYSKAFRRLSGKSQIVVKPESKDHFRSRLTHTLEVKEIANSLGYQLGLSIPLINAIALGHDLGHTPFGHAGEREFQRIMQDDILLLQDRDKARVHEKALRERLQDDYLWGIFPHDVTIVGEKNTVKPHWLFHHAVNSVSVIQRKKLDVDPLVRRGILTHSWAPWQNLTEEQRSACKFGTPLSYEAQVVAVADQVASINHDTEDILTCMEAEQTKQSIREHLPGYLEELEGGPKISFANAHKVMDEWLLPEADCNKDNGFARKRRLQAIINNVCTSSLARLNSKHVTSWEESIQPGKTLTIDPVIGKVLRGYEKYIREEVIQKVSWFGMRDAVAAAVVRTVYMFFKHYAQTTNERIPQEIKDVMESYWSSVEEDEWNRDEHHQVFLSCSKPGLGATVECSLKSLGYVSGMTDDVIMEKHQMAFNVFR